MLAMIILEAGAASDLTIGQVWWVLTLVGGGYATLLGVIYKMFSDQIVALREENKELRGQVSKFEAPLGKMADTTQDINRTLGEMLDGIMPRAPRGGD